MIIDPLTHFNKLVESKKITIVYFYNNECIKTNKIYSELKEKNPNVLFISYDVENKKNQKILDVLQVNIYPYFYIYKNGLKIDMILGTLNIMKILSQYVYT